MTNLSLKLQLLEKKLLQNFHCRDKAEFLDTTLADRATSYQEYV